MHAVKFAAGAIPAGLATYFFIGMPGPELPAPGAGGDAAGARDASLTAYRFANDVDDAAALEAALARALAEPFSVGRDVQIEALFKRLATLDVRRALRFSALPGFDSALVADVFRAWAETDRDAALGALAGIDNPVIRLDVAVALVASLGSDLATIEEIALSLPAHQRIDFQAEAIAARVANDPNDAVRMALALQDPAARNTATQRIAAVWTAEDPVSAMSITDTLPRELQTAYRDAVSLEWVRIDTPAFLGWLDTQPTLDAFRVGMIEAMAIDPENLFEITARHPPVPYGDGFPPNITVERTAFSAVVQRDPERMVAYVESLPDGARRSTLQAAIADSWGRTDPVAARQWAQSLDPPDINIESTVVWSSALVDIDMAVQWLLDFETDTNQPAPIVTIINMATFLANDPRRVEIANGLRARSDDPVATELLRRATAQWVQSDPVGALDWMLEGGSSVDPMMAAGVAARLASRDAQQAADYLPRIPESLRGPWLEQVAAPYARQYPEAVAGWISQFQGEANYEAILVQILRSSAQADPQGAARLLQVAPPSLQASSAGSIASSWVRSDIAGAAGWAVNISDEQARTTAVNQVANAWATRDPAAAERWALGLPRGPTRDMALTAIVGRFSRADYGIEIDSRVFDAFESEQARMAAERRSQLAQ